MKTLVTCLLSMLFFFEAQAQDFWKSYPLTIPTNSIVNDLLVEDAQNIWIATNRGLYHFNSTTAVHTSYATLGQLGGVQKEVTTLERANGRLWLSANDGLYSFDGTSFVRYTSANGDILNNTIEGMGVDAMGQLWIGTVNGISYFNGTQFIHDQMRRTLELGADGDGNIYAYTIYTSPASFQLEVFDGQNWSSTPVSLGSFVSRGFKKLSNGALINDLNNRDYQILDTSLTIPTLSYPWNRSNVPIVRDIEQDASGKHWLATSIGVFSEVNGEMMRHSLLPTYLGDFSEDIRGIDIHQQMVAAVTVNDIFIAPLGVEPKPLSRKIAINKVEAAINVDRAIFHDVETDAGSYVTQEGNAPLVYEAGLMIAVRNPSGQWTVHDQSSSSVPFAVPGPYNTVGSMVRQSIFKVSKQEIEQHSLSYQNSNYVMPTDIALWPALGDTTMGEAAAIAPFVDVNGNGCYDPMNGDYPAIKGDEAIYWINHDAGINQLGNATQLEIHGMLYGFDDPTVEEVNQTLFLEYTIVNRSNMLYDSVKVGFRMDADLGSLYGDYAGTDSLRSTAYMYTTDSIRTVGTIGYGYVAPAIGIRFLSDTLAHNFPTNVGSQFDGDATNMAEKLHHLNARWKDGTPLKFGGDGHLAAGVTNTVTPYAYTGDPFTLSGWSELNTTMSSPPIPNAPHDRRIIPSTAHFSLAPGQRKSFTMAVGYGVDTTAATNLGHLPNMLATMDQSKTLFDTMSVPSAAFATPNCIQTVGIEEQASLLELSLYPNPTAGLLTVSTSEQLQGIELLDIRGALLKSYEGMEQNLIQEVALPTNIENGVYLLRFIARNGTILSKKVILSK